MACSLPNPVSASRSREIPVAVVDDDRTVPSRRLIQSLDAGEAISVAVRAQQRARDPVFAVRVDTRFPDVAR